MDADRELREQLVQLLNGGNAHATFQRAVRGFPVKKAGERPSGAPHSAWELLEHLRIAQNDILRFSQSADYESPKWPEAYWPASPGPEDASEWQKSVAEYQADLKAFEALVHDPVNDLHRKFPWGEGQTLLREALVLADHNSYHIGQLVIVRQLLGAWK